MQLQAISGALVKQGAEMSIREALQKQRKALLDLTYRNRLLSLPKRQSSRSVLIHDELSAQVLRILLEKKAMSFDPIPDGSEIADGDVAREQDQMLDEDNVEMAQPGDGMGEDREPAARHTDSRLQTKLTSESLQKRLLDIYYDSQTMLEEQGVNVLYLAIGQLRYVDSEAASENKRAPLLLLPVRLERKSARDRFVVKWTEDELADNLSLREKLKIDFGMALPEFEFTDDFNVARYLQQVSESIGAKANWGVDNNFLQLGFFSFAKLLMFRDLDPANWPAQNPIDANDLVAGLLGDGFPDSDSCFEPGKDIDKVLSVAEMKYVLDCDSSQTIAIERARRGESLVIQGPPGTGKSQTIANLIGAAVADGKKVLFIAEKMAALEVVKRRLANLGLGSLCLELHSNKASKKIVLESIADTLRAGPPVGGEIQGEIERLGATRSRLNAHAEMMHMPIGASGNTPFMIVGSLSKLLRSTSRPPIRLESAREWTMAEADSRSSLLSEIADRLVKVGNPTESPWRGVKLPPVMRPIAEDLLARSKPVISAMALVTTKSVVLAEALAIPAAKTLSELEHQCKAGEQLAQAPRFDRATIASAVWTAGLGALGDAIENGRKLSEVIARRGDSTVEVAWETDWVSQRQVIAAHGRSLFRWLNGPYKQALNQLRSVNRATLSTNYEDRLSFADDLIVGSKANKALEESSLTAKAALGEIWNGRHTDWDLADSIVSWVRKQSASQSGVFIRTLASKIAEPRALGEHAKLIGAAAAEFKTRFEALSTSLRLDIEAAFGKGDIRLVQFHEIVERVGLWQHDVDGLMAWTNFVELREVANDQGLSDAIDLMVDRPELRPNAVDVFWAAFYFELLLIASSKFPQLASFDGQRHGELVKQFRELDSRRVELARIEVAAAHFQSVPRLGVGAGSMGILRGEIARQRGHMAIRKLMRLCGVPIQAVKPVFMMSPLSVAQFLEPGVLNFDLLVMDEASQVEPVDALGAIARCSQVVVVGDDKQLPPTSFFSRVVESDDDADSEEGAQARDLESILSLCSAKGLPQTMLQWHYRSRHESLIAVSNKQFYNGELFIVPSPDRNREQLGLKLHYFAEGRFDRGNSQKNHVEAVEIANAVIRHARERPNLTLGVGAMSVRQRQAISDQIELARRQQPDIEPFFARHADEPFFVKNLENIQGDERDVIFISVGYGRSKSDNQLYQNFGPINADGGYRRLNVLITRARQRCEVFTSMLSDEIRVDEQSKPGLVALKTFLRYAECGDLGVPQFTGKPADSPFEESVQAVLTARDFEVHNQVGVAGFFIDLAVVDPESQGRYLLGIECDGATYHSSRSARDRDRLRQEILEANGWSIHRIWSTEWFQREGHEVERLMRALEVAKSRAARPPRSRPAAAPVQPELLRVETLQEVPGRSTEQSIAYEVAAFTPENRELEPHRVSIGSMASTVIRIIEIEGPIHLFEVVARVRDLWGLGRAGSRIEDIVQRTIEHLIRVGKIAAEDMCYMLLGQDVRVRDRSGFRSQSLKSPDYLPPQEVREAIVKIVRESHGIDCADVPVAVARALGILSTSQGMRSLVDKQTDVLISRGIIAIQSGLLVAK